MSDVCMAGAGVDDRGRYWVKCANAPQPGSTYCAYHTGRHKSKRNAKAKRKRQGQARKANR
jgi:hypothetical protein